MEIRAAPGSSGTAKYSPFARGSSFKVTDKGPLFVLFEPGHVVALRPVPPRFWYLSRSPPQRWYSLLDGPVELSAWARDVLRPAPDGSSPLFRNATPSPTDLKRRADFRRFMEHVSPPVASVLAEGWTGRTWGLFRFLQNCPEAVEMAQTQAGAHVVFALANAHALLRKAPKNALAFARRWIRRPRKQILARLGFPCAPSSVDCLSRIPRPQVDTHTVALMSAALQEPATRKLVFHLPRVSATALYLLRPSLRSVVTPKLLASVAEHPAAGFAAEATAHALQDTLSMASVVGRTLRPFESVASIQETHDALVRERQRRAGTLEVHFPLLSKIPSIEPDVVVEPLPSLSAFLAEGARMSHCLGSIDEQIDDAAGGRLFAFAVRRPNERLTLAIARADTRAPFYLHDLRRAHNALPSDDALVWAEQLIAALNQDKGLRSRSIAPRRGAHRGA